MKIRLMLAEKTHQQLLLINANAVPLGINFRK
jgi:hypothetical protein